MKDPMKIEEIADAIELLEEFDNSLPSDDKIDCFIDGIRGLNNYLEDFPDSQHATFINNKKVAHARRLLKFLNSIDSSDFSRWFGIACALISLNTEIEQLAENYPELKNEYDKFFSEWKGTPELRQIITLLKK